MIQTRHRNNEGKIKWTVSMNTILAVEKIRGVHFLFFTVVFLYPVFGSSGTRNHCTAKMGFILTVHFISPSLLTCYRNAKYFAYTRAWADMRIRAHGCVHVCACVRVCVCACLCVCVCIHVACIYLFTSIRMFVHTHMYRCIAMYFNILEHIYT